jgi:hypothetical protein
VPRNPALAYDPRTIARDVAGVIESVFPQLVPGMVLHFNRAHSYSNKNCKPVPSELIAKTSLQQAMLFELGIAVGESLLAGEPNVDWDKCLLKASGRQQRYYDAEVPDHLESVDKEIALRVGNNLFEMLRAISVVQGSAITIQPRIPGYRWIASGAGDFSTSESIIEVKCSSKRFATADYRQILIYWLLAYVESLEKDLACWTTGILLNPRLNFSVKLNFSEFIPLVALGKSSIEIVESFAAIFQDWTQGNALSTWQ